jgi:hypothetical protein
MMWPILFIIGISLCWSSDAENYFPELLIFRPECSCEHDVNEYESSDAQGEHYSWELGTNDSIPETVVIENPFITAE